MNLNQIETTPLRNGHDRSTSLTQIALTNNNFIEPDEAGPGGAAGTSIENLVWDSQSNAPSLKQ